LYFDLRRYKNKQGSIYWKILPPPWGEGKISADVIWGKNMKRGKEKEGKMDKKKEERGKKMIKEEVKG
jgi:hypothetical protein